MATSWYEPIKGCGMSISTKTYYTERRKNKLMSLLTIHIHIGLRVYNTSSRGFGQAYQSLTKFCHVWVWPSFPMFDHFCPHLSKSDQDWPRLAKCLSKPSQKGGWGSFCYFDKVAVFGKGSNQHKVKPTMLCGVN